ncbi:MAG: DNA polymerase III subunit alpha, partial [Deltaproteobacteria bacterium]|nr:DNA polymerase III subunit alpha [Deltaproteobacteria bacterium]
AGVVIADQPLVTYAPLYRDEPGGGPVVQFDMKSAESIGLIKFDFLGLKTLDQLRDALILVQENWGVTIDLALIPDDDDATYHMLHQGDALGVFQLESSGMRDLLTRLKPSSMDDMVALVALYRPGPLQSGMTDEFVDRKHGRKAVSYPLPSLEPYLKETYGTVIYQEQVMQIAQVMAGYTLGEADLLRRAMGKKDKVEMERQKSRFASGAEAKGIAAALATEVFDNLAKFAEYGFNKSHSAAYGWISYQTAWLKAHYRPEYMAALMTIEAANTDKVLEYVLDCRRAGISVDAVCINRSFRAFTVPPGAERPVVDGKRVDTIRFGLAAVKNVGEGSIEAILQARKGAGGRFESAFDFFERVDWKRLNRRVVEGLVKAGAFDMFGHGRAALMDGLDAAITHGQRRAEERAAGQANLFAALGGGGIADFRWPTVQEWPLSVRLAYEKEVLGLYLSGHPMQAHARDVERFSTQGRTLSEARSLAGVDEVRLMGLVVDTRTVRTRRGDKMAFVKLEDQGAAIEIVFFAQAWARSQRAVESQEPILVTGEIEEPGEGDDVVKLKATTAEPLSEVRARTTREVRIEVLLDELKGDRLQRLHDILQSQRGACRSRLIVRSPGRFRTEWRLPNVLVDPSPGMEEQVATLLGRLDAVVLS